MLVKFTVPDMQPQSFVNNPAKLFPDTIPAIASSANVLEIPPDTVLTMNSVALPDWLADSLNI